MSELRKIIDRLGERYELKDAMIWLESPQKLLDGQIPAEMILAGRAAEVHELLDQFDSGAHP